MLDLLWVLLSAGLVFLMQAGFMCLESGLTRSKNSINVAVKNMADFGLSFAIFWGLGYGIMFGQSSWGWWGTNQFFFSGTEGASQTAFFIYQAMFCGTATTIISGAVAERLRFGAYLAIAALVAGIIYPFFGHWAWNEGGWLRSLGFIDFAGSTVVHGLGAWISLATLILVGPRQHRFRDGKPQKIQGSNMPFSVLGALLLWFGWIGFNGGSTLALNEQVPGIVLNTLLSGVAGMVTAAVFSWMQHRVVEVESLINGSLAGLVAVTACCHAIATPIAVIVGITGAAVAVLVDRQLEQWRIDDAVGAIAVHGGAGLWGTLCVGLFGSLAILDTGLNRVTQIGVQLLGIGIAGIWTLGLSWVLLQGLNRLTALRVSPEAEDIGLNVCEHHAKTEVYDLLEIMDYQARTHDLSLRAPVEPFTEVGHIATRYNQVMTALEKQHRENIKDLEDLYYLAAIAVGALDRRDRASLDFGDLVDRDDDLGILARTLQQLTQTIQERDQALIDAETEIYREVLIAILKTRFQAVPSEVYHLERDRFKSLIQDAIAAENLESFTKTLHLSQL